MRKSKAAKSAALQNTKAAEKRRTPKYQKHAEPPFFHIRATLSRHKLATLGTAWQHFIAIRPERREKDSRPLSLIKNYLAGRKRPKRVGGLVAGFKGAEPCLIGLMAGSLSGDLSTADVRQLIREAQPLLEKLPLRYAPGDKNVFPLRYWRLIWRTPEGREFARDIVFQQAPVTRCVQMIMEIHAVEGIYEGAFAKGVAPHQKEVAWSLVRDTFDEYLTGNVAQRKIAFFAGKVLYVWTDGFGSGVAPRFCWSLARAELRAPMAYVFGRRYLVLNKPKVATAFSTTRLRTRSRTRPSPAWCRRNWN